MSLITVEVSSKNRYDVLHQALMSIAMQTYRPFKLIIFDDSEDNKRIDLRQINIYNNIFKLFDKRNILWEVRFSPQHGQVKNHIEALNLCKTPFLFRMDDD
ncbi:MAG: glycosyltransferase family A protein, partial [Nanoarchaeota archaeon]